MNFSQHDTDWQLSAKGNWWRRVNGTALVVGQTKDGRIWALVGEEFLKGKYTTISNAQDACEREAE